MTPKLSTLVAEWARESAAADLLQVYDQISYLREQLFDEYEPTKRAGVPSFPDRLQEWLENLATTPLTPESKKDQQTLLRLVNRLVFIGRREFESLYQAAFNGPITRWLIEQGSIPIDDPSASLALQKAVAETWFCPVTDSLKIADFYHINHISGPDLRPDWRTLAKLGSEPNISSYIKAHNYKRIVLLEDFVGSGSQMSEAVPFACGLTTNTPVLMCPLIVCPGGVKTGKGFESTYPGKLTFRPVVRLPESYFLTDPPTPGEPAFFSDVRELAKRHEHLVADLTDQKWYGALGFGNTGGLVVMYTNCPDNTLPLVHYKSAGSSWKPVFPRASRL